MKKSVADVCTVVLAVLLCLSETCFSLQVNFEIHDSVNVHAVESVAEAAIPDTSDFEQEQKWQIYPIFAEIFRGSADKAEDALNEIDGEPKRRVVRQAYQGQTQLYPNLPSGPPYGLEPYPNFNNQNPSHNPQWQQPYNNNPSQPGYNSQINGYQPGYKPNNFSNNIPSGTFGQNPQPNQWQPNGYQSNHNNPYGTNTQQSMNNHSQPAYPYNGYRPNNFTSPQGPYGQNPPPWQPQQPNNGQIPYNQPNGSYASNNNNGMNPYSAYKPYTYNNTSFRPPYNQPGQFQNNTYSSYPPQSPGHRSPYGQPGQFQNNSYSGFPPQTPNHTPPYNQPGHSQNNSYSSYPSHTPGYRPPNNANQQPQFYNSYPGQTQVNTTRYPPVVPGNQHPIIYDDSTKRPRQSPYGSYNTSNWSGSTLNNTQTPYNSQNSQNSQYFNSYPGSPGYRPQNSNNPYNVPNQRPSYLNTNFGQNSSNNNNYLGPSADSATYNQAQRYNPAIPNKPPYGSAPPYQSEPYSNRAY